MDTNYYKITATVTIHVSTETPKGAAKAISKALEDVSDNGPYATDEEGNEVAVDLSFSNMSKPVECNDEY